MIKILVVDDKPHERNTVCSVLESAGYYVRSAVDGIEALEKIRDDSFDLLLVDVRMPRMNGPELLASLPKVSRPRVVIITDDDSPEVLIYSLREKTSVFIAKPMEPERLLQLVRETLQSPPEADQIEILSAEPNWLEIRFPCVVREADHIETVVDQLNQSLSPGVRQSLRMALHELLLNALKWGGHGGPSAQAQIEYLRTPKFILCRVADSGSGFVPSDCRHSSLERDVPEAFPSGWRTEGFELRFAKSLVDELVYTEAQNQIAIVKYLD
jgi:DNA-binding response OmpR family regulator